MKEHTRTPEFICIEEDIRERYFDGYVDGILSESQQAEFADHLLICDKCQEDVEYLQWVNRRLQQSPTQQELETPFLDILNASPLPVTSVCDWNKVELTHHYYKKPLQERLIASTGTSDEIAFPFTVEYADGKITGQFWKRAGRLFFRVKEFPPDSRLQDLHILYQSSANPEERKIYSFQEHREILLGEFGEFVAEITLQGMLNAVRQFHVILSAETG